MLPDVCYLGEWYWRGVCQRWSPPRFTVIVRSDKEWHVFHGIWLKRISRRYQMYVILVSGGNVSQSWWTPPRFTVTTEIWLGRDYNLPDASTTYVATLSNVCYLSDWWWGECHPKLNPPRFTVVPRHGWGGRIYYQMLLKCTSTHNKNVCYLSEWWRGEWFPKLEPPSPLFYGNCQTWLKKESNFMKWY